MGKTGGWGVLFTAIVFGATAVVELHDHQLIGIGDALACALSCFIYSSKP